MKPSAIIPIVLVFAMCIVGLWWISRPVPVPMDSSNQWQLDSLTSVLNEANARADRSEARADSAAHVADSLSRIRQNPDVFHQQAVEALKDVSLDSSIRILDALPK